MVDEQAERELLGALLAYWRSDVFADAQAVLVDDDWSDPRHKIIWRAIAALADREDHVDTTTLGYFLTGQHDAARRTYLDLAGGNGYLAALVSYAVPHGVVERARIVHADGTWRRRLRSALEQMEACHARDEAAYQRALGVESPRLRVIHGERAAS